MGWWWGAVEGCCVCDGGVGRVLCVWVGVGGGEWGWRCAGVVVVVVVCVRRGPPFPSENPSKMISVSVGHTCRPRNRRPRVHPVIM